MSHMGKTEYQEKEEAVVEAAVLRADLAAERAAHLATKAEVARLTRERDDDRVCLGKISGVAKKACGGTIFFGGTVPSDATPLECVEALAAEVERLKRECRISDQNEAELGALRQAIQNALPLDLTGWGSLLESVPKMGIRLAVAEADAARLREVLAKLRDPKMWKRGGAGGADSYLGGPPALRIIDAALAGKGTS